MRSGNKSVEGVPSKNAERMRRLQQKNLEMLAAAQDRKYLDDHLMPALYLSLRTILDEKELARMLSEYDLDPPPNPIPIEAEDGPDKKVQAVIEENGLANNTTRSVDKQGESITIEDNAAENETKLSSDSPVEGEHIESDPHPARRSETPQCEKTVKGPPEGSSDQEKTQGIYGSSKRQKKIKVRQDR